MGKPRPREVQQPTGGGETGTRTGTSPPPSTPPTEPQTCFSKASCPSPRPGHGAIYGDGNQQEKSDARKEPGYRLFLEGRGAAGGPGAELRQPGFRPSAGQGRADQARRARGFPPGPRRRQHREAICPSICLSSSTSTDGPRGPGAAPPPPTRGLHCARHTTQPFVLINWLILTTALRPSPLYRRRR